MTWPTQELDVVLYAYAWVAPGVLPLVAGGVSTYAANAVLPV